MSLDVNVTGGVDCGVTFNQKTTFTVTWWMQIDSTPGGGYYLSQRGGDGNGTYIQDTTSTHRAILVTIKRATTDAVAQAVADTLGTSYTTPWNFCAVSYDGSTYPHIYVATQQGAVAEVTYESGKTGGSGSHLETAGGHFIIGNRTSFGAGMDGRIADVRLFSTVLTTAQLEVVKRQAYRPFPDFGWWKLRNAGTAKDLSGLGFDGSLTSATAAADPPFIDAAAYPRARAVLRKITAPAAPSIPPNSLMMTGAGV